MRGGGGGGAEEDLVYSEETAGLFGFEPGLDTALTEEVKEITVTYSEKSAEVYIRDRGKCVQTHSSSDQQ